jgi:hypothetical protein
VLRIRRHEHAGHRTGHQNQAPRGCSRPERERCSEIGSADYHERQRHHPPVGRPRRGERADRTGDRVEPRLQAGGDRPPADQQDRSRRRREHAPPRHVPHITTVGESLVATLSAHSPPRGAGTDGPACALVHPAPGRRPSPRSGDRTSRPQAHRRGGRPAAGRGKRRHSRCPALVTCGPLWPSYTQVPVDELCIRTPVTSPNANKMPRSVDAGRIA